MGQHSWGTSLTPRPLALPPTVEQGSRSPSSLAGLAHQTWVCFLNRCRPCTDSFLCHWGHSGTGNVCLPEGEEWGQAPRVAALPPALSFLILLLSLSCLGDLWWRPDASCAGTYTFVTEFPFLWEPVEFAICSGAVLIGRNHQNPRCPRSC